MDLQSRTVQEVMLPLAKVASVDAAAPVAEVVALCRERGLTRMPVWGTQGGVRRVTGLVNLRTILYHATKGHAGEWFKAGYNRFGARVKLGTRGCQDGIRLGALHFRGRAKLDRQALPLFALRTVQEGGQYSPQRHEEREESPGDAV